MKIVGTCSPLLLVLALSACDREDRKVGAIIPSFASELLEFRNRYGKDMPKLDEEGQKLEDLALARVRERLPDPGLEVGTKAPDFTLPDAYGDPVTLSQELEKGPVILVFYRGAWCPICNTHLRVLQKSLDIFRRYNAHVLAITPQKPDMSRDQIEEKNLGFEVLSDLDYSVIKEYRLYFEVPEALKDVYVQTYGFDLEKYNGEGRYSLPIPGTLVIDSEGVVRASHANSDYSDRMEPKDIVDALEAIADR